MRRAEPLSDVSRDVMNLAQDTSEVTKASTVLHDFYNRPEIAEHAWRVAHSLRHLRDDAFFIAALLHEIPPDVNDHWDRHPEWATARDAVHAYWRIREKTNASAEQLAEIERVVREQPRTAPHALALLFADRLQHFTEDRYGVVSHRKLSPDELRRQATRLRTYWMPLAASIGLSPLVSEMGNHAFEILDRDRYERVKTRYLPAVKKARPHVQALEGDLRALFAKNGVPADVSTREKSFYRIHEKEAARRQPGKPATIHDLMGLRVVVHEPHPQKAEKLARRALALARQHLAAVGAREYENEFDDYFKKPKLRAPYYRALHAAFRHPQGFNFELQFRTRASHEFIEQKLPHFHYATAAKNAAPVLRGVLDALHALRRDAERGAPHQPVSRKAGPLKPAKNKR